MATLVPIRSHTQGLSLYGLPHGFQYPSQQQSMLLATGMLFPGIVMQKHMLVLRGMQARHY